MHIAPAARRNALMSALRAALYTAINTVLRVGLLLAVAACADAPFERVNAYDGLFTTPGTIVGLPDSITVFGDSAQLSVDAGERYRDVPRRWKSRQLDSDDCLFTCGLMIVDEWTGKYVATPTSHRIRWEIRVQMGAQVYLDTVALRQMPVRFRTFCRWGCDADAHNAAIEYTLADAELFDAKGVLMQYAPDTLKRSGASLTIRDTTIVHFVNGQLRARYTDGATWIVRRQFGQLDSVRSVVQQRFAPPQLICPATAAVSDTVRVAVAPLKDVGGAPLLSPVTYRWQSGVLKEAGYVPRPILADGSFVPTEPGTWQVYLDATHATAVHWAACVVQVS